MTALSLLRTSKSRSLSIVFFDDEEFEAILVNHYHVSLILKKFEFVCIRLNASGVVDVVVVSIYYPESAGSMSNIFWRYDAISGGVGYISLPARIIWYFRHSCFNILVIHAATFSKLRNNVTGRPRLLRILHHLNKQQSPWLTHA